MTKRQRLKFYHQDGKRADRRTSQPRVRFDKLFGMRSLWIGWVVVIGLWPRPAAAYVCTRADQAALFLTQAWNQRCLPYWINRGSEILRTEAGQAIVRESFAQWSNPACTDLNFIYAGVTAQSAEFDEFSDNNRNVIVTTQTATEAAVLIGEPELLAIALTSYSTDTGEIFDADIVLNTALFPFDNVQDPAACSASNQPVFDLKNTLVHEIGHFIGFDHTPEPDATMLASAGLCEIVKRDLAPTDLDGLCTVYGAGRPTETCAPPASYGSGGFLDRFRDQCGRLQGCTCTGRSGAEPAWWVLLMALPLMFRRGWSRRRTTL